MPASTLALALALTAPSLPQEGGRVDYSRDVRPLLADRCLPCHGPDEEARAAGLRLDLRASAVEDRGGYRVIDTRAAAESELLVRVRDELDPMPPGPDHAPLSAAEADLLERWIREGAPYEDHWAYRELERPEVPEIADPRWAQGSIDLFVLAGIEAAGLEPAPRADGRTRARRLSFDLLGLPPTMDQVESIVRDPGQSAWENLVEELLGSPHHAERMTTFWFDLVRFADTTGIHADNRWNVRPYRDWVIEAFRSNMPFDRFTIEQVAGDLLPDASRSQRVAAAYNRLNLITREGGSQPKEFLARYTADRVRNLTEVWLASTVGCAECHDHKFDPFSTREFYELGAFFADIDQVGVYQSGENTFPPEFPVPSMEQEQSLARVRAALAEVLLELEADSLALADDQVRFEEELRDQRWRAPDGLTVATASGREVEVLADGVLRTEDEGADTDTFTVGFPSPAARYGALRLELLPDPALPNEGPGLAANGNLVLTEVTVRVGGAAVAIASSSASFEQPNYPVSAAHDGALGRGGWAVMRGQDGAPAEAVLVLEEPIGGPDGGPVEIELVQQHGRKHLLGRWRVTVGRASAVPIAPELRAALEASDVDPGEAARATLRRLHRARTPLLASARAERARLEAEEAKLVGQIPMVLETRAVAPRVTRVLPRGDWMDDTGEVVAPGVPSALGELRLEGSGPATRLDLARWLVAPENPLVARVLVNRVWRMLMGRGIVETLDDFGVQGSSPTHTALLDHLATSLIESGWDLRHLIRQIVCSATYQQSSWVEDAPGERDATFARQRRHRLDAEFIRDGALAASGLLNRRIGGASVRPYQPEGYWSHLNFPRRTYQPSTGSDLHRRALYGHWQRQFVHPGLAAFDAPSRERCVSERPRSNTPLAALALLNDPIHVEAARALAERAIVEGGPSEESRASVLWRRVLQREPTFTETARVLALTRHHRATFALRPDSTESFLGVGDVRPTAEVPAAELAAWTSAARVVLNLHEAIVRE